MKANAYPTPLVLRSAAHAMREHGAPVRSVGRLLALADVAERNAADFVRLSCAVLVALPDEPAGAECGRIERAAFVATYGEVSL